MKIDFRKALGKVVAFAKQNPEVVLAVAGGVSPKLVRKVAPVIVAVVGRKDI